MANDAVAFGIDDQKTVDENIGAFIAEITAIDSELATVLAPKLRSWARGEQVEHAGLLDALFAATAPVGDGAQ